jgi:hypothetical protein
MRCRGFNHQPAARPVFRECGLFPLYSERAAPLSSICDRFVGLESHIFIDWLRMTLQANYLVVGTGAMGMAFVDTLLTETDATIVMVDNMASRAAIGMMLTPSYIYINRRLFMVSIQKSWVMMP